MPSYDLVVTTPERICQWSPDSDTSQVLFESESGGGIVAAKAAHDDLIAIADSQVVILYHTRGGLNQSYRLRSDHEGRVHTLQYDPDHERLYFTTTLQHAVQSFSLRDGQLLDPTAQHPNPPTAFAVSRTTEVLLSASAEPTTIYLTSVLPGRIPLLLQPTCSASAVASVAFHPERGVFALAFADGSLVTYDVERLRKNLETTKTAAWDSGEIAHVLGLHQTVMSDDGLPAGTMAVCFAQGPGCTTVSAGLDARCCVVQFERRGLATISRTWQVPVSATAVAAAQTASTGSVVAVGLIDGTVRLYTLDGNPLTRHSFKARIIGIEWTLRDGDAASFHLQPRAPSEIIIRRSRKVSVSSNARSTHSRRVTSVKRTHAVTSRPPPPPPPSVPPRPVPKEGGKLAQMQAERASLGSGSPRNPQSPASDPHVKMKGKKIIIQTHGRMKGRHKASSGPSLTPSTASWTPRSHDTILDWTAAQEKPKQQNEAASARKVVPPKPGVSSKPVQASSSLPSSSSVTSGSNDTMLDWTDAKASPERPAVEASPASPSLVTTWSKYSSSYEYLPARPPNSMPGKHRLSPRRLAQKSTPGPQPTHRAPTAQQAPASHDAPATHHAPEASQPATTRLPPAPPSDAQSLLTNTTQSTGTIIDWIPHASQEHAPRPRFAGPGVISQILTESPANQSSGSSFVFHRAADANASDPGEDRTPTPKASDRGSGGAPTAPRARARARAATATTDGVTPRNGGSSGMESGLTPIFLRGVFEDEFAVFQTRVMLELRNHRDWLAAFMQDHVGATLHLGEENRHLREELARLRRGTGGHNR